MLEGPPIGPRTITMLSRSRQAASKILGGQFVTVEDKPAKMGDKVLGIAERNARKNQKYTVHILGVSELVVAAPIKCGEYVQSDD